MTKKHTLYQYIHLSENAMMACYIYSYKHETLKGQMFKTESAVSGKNKFGFKKHLIWYTCV